MIFTRKLDLGKLKKWIDFCVENKKQECWKNMLDKEKLLNPDFLKLFTFRIFNTNYL